MPNLFETALSTLISAQGTTRGGDCEITIGSGSQAQTVPCIIETDQFNSAFPDMGGGVTESGTQRVMVQKSLLTPRTGWVNGEPPINVTPTVIDGVRARVLAVNQAHGILYIVTGQVAGQ